LSTAYNFWRSHSARLTKAALRRYRYRQELLFADTILKLTVIAPRHRRSNGSLASQHAVGAVANLVSASGVMVSLIHLGIQIRQHTGTEQAQVFNEIFSNSTAQNLVMFGPTHIDVVISGMQAFNGLSARDKLRFDH
jgi:hypothetical protein